MSRLGKATQQEEKGPNLGRRARDTPTPTVGSPTGTLSHTTITWTEDPAQTHTGSVLSPVSVSPMGPAYLILWVVLSWCPQPLGSYNPSSPSLGFPWLCLGLAVGLSICSRQLLEEASLMTVGLGTNL